MTSRKHIYKTVNGSVIFHEYQIVVRILRQGQIDLVKAIAVEAVRYEKAQVMYDFLTSKKFAKIIE